MSHGTRSNQVTVNPWSPDSDFLTTEYTEHTEGNPCTVMPCFRVFRFFRGSLVFGGKNQSVAAGLGFFKPRNTQNTRKGILCTVMPCFRIFGLFRGSLVFGDKNQSVVAGLGFFKPRNTQNTRKGILARLCLVSVYSGCSVVP